MLATKKEMEVEMLAMRKKMEGLMLHMTSVCSHLQQNNNPMLEGQAAFDNSHRDQKMHSYSREIHTRTVRIDFFTFHREDPLGWIYKVNQFFIFLNTHPQYSMRLVFLHMEERALVWF